MLKGLGILCICIAVLTRLRRHPEVNSLSIYVEKLVGAEQSLAKIGEGLQFGRGFRGGFGFFVFLFGFLFVFRFWFRRFRFGGLFLASSFQMVKLPRQKFESVGPFGWSRTSAEGKLPGAGDLSGTIIAAFFLQALSKSRRLVEN